MSTPAIEDLALSVEIKLQAHETSIMTIITISFRLKLLLNALNML